MLPVLKEDHSLNPRTHGKTCVCGSTLRNPSPGAGEMTQWLRALTVLPEVLSSFSSNNMVAHNHLSIRGSDVLFWPVDTYAVEHLYIK